VEIPLGHVVLSHLQPVKVSREKDALALTACLGFDYKSLSFLLVKLGLKILRILWQKPGLGEEIEILRASLFYCHKVFR